MKKFCLFAAMICSLVLTSCDVEIESGNAERYQAKEYSSKLANTSWQLVEIYSKSSHTWVAAESYPDFGIKDLTFGAGGKFNICIHNYYGYRGDHTFYGDYSFSLNTINLKERTLDDNFITIYVKNLNDNLLDATIDVWDDNKSTYCPDGYEVTHSRQVEHYNVRMIRVR